MTGSFIFLAIEGGASQMQQRTLASTNRHKPIQSYNNNAFNSNNNVTLSQAAIQDTIDARQRTVENIWDITVSLNILYRENWTRYVQCFIIIKLCLCVLLDILSSSSSSYSWAMGRYVLNEKISKGKIFSTVFQGVWYF